MKKLDPFSNQAIAELFAYYPKWRAYLKVSTYNDEDFYDILIPPHPNSNLTESLFIETVNEEVTVGMDYFHAHFWHMKGIDETPEYEIALPFIEELVSEKVSVISWLNGGSWRGSACIDSGDESEIYVFDPPYTTIRIRSWKGTYDQDINI